jgi:hypothetical protein
MDKIMGLSITTMGAAAATVAVAALPAAAIIKSAHDSDFAHDTHHHDNRTCTAFISGLVGGFAVAGALSINSTARTRGAQAVAGAIGGAAIATLGVTAATAGDVSVDILQD